MTIECEYDLRDWRKNADRGGSRSNEMDTERMGSKVIEKLGWS